MASITTVALAACVASSSIYWVAVLLLMSACLVAAAPFAAPVSNDTLRALVESLRAGQHTSAAPVYAVVTSLIIFLPRSALSSAPSRRYAMLFRDEMHDAQWRELATLLRHQPYPSPELNKVHHGAAYRLGKSSDM